MYPRLKAFLTHFIFSTLVAVLVVGLVFFIWYPAPLHTATGVTKILLLVLTVDVIIGPLLTLLVYKVGKKTLVLDLTIIVFLQLSALMYGLYTVADGRPAWLVFSKDRFELIRIPDIDERNLNEALDKYRNPSWLGPQWVAAEMPFFFEDQNQVLFESVAGGPDISQRPNFYQPLSYQSKKLKHQARPLSELYLFNSIEHVDQLLARYPLANSWLPLSASAQDMVVLLNMNSAEVVSIVNLSPWN